MSRTSSILPSRSRTLLVIGLAAGVLAVGAAPAWAGTAKGNPDRYDRDGNGIPDEGVVVSGQYEESWTDPDSGVTCRGRVNYRGAFENDPFLNSGWIQNHWQCDDGSSFNYLFVHETDPRYTGDPDRAIWGEWEWAGLTESGVGNVAKPHHPEYAF